MNVAHEISKHTKDEWLTPPDIITSLGKFDLDPCAPVVRPWNTAEQHYTIHDNGLMLMWFGRVWMNPPYGKHLAAWMEKMAWHNNGIALIFSRTDIDVFHRYVFEKADSIYFIKRRLNFYNVDGTCGNTNAGAPSVLIAYGEENSDALSNVSVAGKHILLNRTSIVVVGTDSTWRTIVHTSLINLNNKASLNVIYEMVESVAPDKVKKNKHYQEKVRQTLALYFDRIKRGEYKTK